MKVIDLVHRLDLTVLAGEPGERLVDGCYISDLLSLAMGRVGKGNIWITVQGNVNIVAVAVLTEAACIIIPEGVQPMENTVDKANQENVVIFSCEKTAYELAAEISRL